MAAEGKGVVSWSLLRLAGCEGRCRLGKLKTVLRSHMAYRNGLSEGFLSGACFDAVSSLPPQITRSEAGEDRR